MSTDSFYVYLMLITIATLFIYSLKIFKFDIISPSVITLGLFFISIICFTYNVNYWKIVFTFKAYSLFTLSFITMITVEFFIKNTKFVVCRDSEKIVLYEEENNKLPCLYISKEFNFFIVSFIICAGLYYIYNVYKTGMSLGAKNFFYAIGIAKEESEFNFVSRLLFNLIRFISYDYALIMFQNMIVFKKKLFKNISSIIVLSMTIICLFASGQRSALITYIFGLLIISFVILYDAKKQYKINITRTFKKILILCLILLSIFYLSRNAVKGRTTTTPFLEYMTYYFGSTFCLMGRIIDDPSMCNTERAGYFGEKTFNGLYHSLYDMKIITKEPGPPGNVVWLKLGGLSPSYRAGNEFTFLCAPYLDFGFIGTLIFIFFTYTFFSLLYYKCILNRKPTIKRYIILIIYSYLFNMISLSFYMDNIRSLSRPITIVYFLFISIFTTIFVRKKYTE